MTEQTQASPALTRAHAESHARAGLYYGISAYTMWGVFPLYFRAVANVKPWVVLCHRVFWSALFLAVLIQFRGEWGAIRQALASRRNIRLLSLGSVLIALNWLIFIYAVGSKQVLQASLGYFINPLVSIALGMIFLRERLRPLQWVAVAIAVVAVLYFALHGGAFPWIALSLAASFAFYGLVKKKVDVNSLHGLLVETAVLLPLSILVIAFLPAARISSSSWAILSASGIITAVPLLFFGAAVQRLQLSTVGFLQYIGPTLQLLVAVTFVGEKLDSVKLTSFGICWVGIAVYILDSILSHKPQPVADEPD